MSRKPNKSGRHRGVSDRHPSPETSTSASSASTNASAITKPSEIAAPAPVAAAPSTSVSTALVAHAPDVGRPLPPPLRVAHHGGDAVTLAQDQLYADRVMIRKGERGRVMYPSSQAAAWVVHFPRIGPKYRVVPEPLLTRG